MVKAVDVMEVVEMTETAEVENNRRTKDVGRKVKEQRKCKAVTCFANTGGLCDALEYAEDGYGDTRPCPFYKKKDDVEKDRIDALERVVNKDRFDLIRKYRPTLEQVGVLDAGKAEDSFFDAHSGDIRELQELAYIEQEIRNGRVVPCAVPVIGESDEWDEPDEWAEPDDEGSGVFDAHSDSEAGWMNGGIDDS